MQDQLAAVAGRDGISAMPTDESGRSRADRTALRAAGIEAFARGPVLASYGQASSLGIPMIVRGN
jgi:hypothetical protein